MATITKRAVIRQLKRDRAEAAKGVARATRKAAKGKVSAATKTVADKATRKRMASKLMQEKWVKDATQKYADAEASPQALVMFAGEIVKHWSNSDYRASDDAAAALGAAIKDAQIKARKVGDAHRLSERDKRGIGKSEMLNVLKFADIKGAYKKLWTTLSLTARNFTDTKNACLRVVQYYNGNGKLNGRAVGTARTKDTLPSDQWLRKIIIARKNQTTKAIGSRAGISGLDKMSPVALNDRAAKALTVLFRKHRSLVTSLDMERKLKDARNAIGALSIALASKAKADAKVKDSQKAGTNVINLEAKLKAMAAKLKAAQKAAAAAK